MKDRNCGLCGVTIFKGSSGRYCMECTIIIDESIDASTCVHTKGDLVKIKKLYRKLGKLITYAEEETIKSTNKPRKSRSDKGKPRASKNT